MNESPIYSKTYDLLLWLLPAATRFPRAHRFGLGENVTRKALSLQETLISAGMRRDASRLALLKQADVELAQLKQALRLCHDLQLFSTGQYEHIARMLVEIGRLLGGWLKTSS
jgi:four helix bundle protein